MGQIYEEIEYRTGISRNLGMQTEIDTELEFCHANPYMLELYHILTEKIRGKDKKLICVSDMYLPSNVLKDLLGRCGYEEIDDIYVSCEEGASKADGSLYGKIVGTYGEDKTYFHVGDNLESDGKRAKENGWNHVHYPNVHLAGNPYRAEDMSLLTGTLYGGIVNARMHNGLAKYTPDYESGYIYGGIFVLGYCQFIHDYVSRHEIDKVLFLARDGDVLYKAYRFLYGKADERNQDGQRNQKWNSRESLEENPKEKTHDTEYVYWSRKVATKLMAGHDRHDFLRRFVEHKVNKKYTLTDIFGNMQILDMLKGLCLECGNQKYDVRPGSFLTDKNANVVCEYLLHHWSELERHYCESMEAGKRYFGRVLENCHKVAAVDVGWAGSGALALDTLVNDEWELDCEMVGIVAGTNTFHNAEPNATEPFLFKEPDVDAGKVEQIQQGILDFVRDYREWVPDEYQKKHHISGADAYAVLRILLQGGMGTELEEGI